MTKISITLAELGWRPHFQAQLELEELERAWPMRVLASHRGEADLLGEHALLRLSTSFADDFDTMDQPTTGDWLLVDQQTQAPLRVLERTSLIKRRAAGLESRLQLIAANVDTLFITTSCNADFNPARLERYLALALDSGIEPVILLTKADLVSGQEAQDYRAQAEALRPGLLVETMDSRDATSRTRLSAWTGIGQTVAIVGSSGVGKSTLVNTLTGEDAQETAGIRENDAKGRHTTTGRSMHRLHDGGWLLDTPGMRELRLADASFGLDTLFEDIIEIAQNCRFSDCAHDTEPGCAIQQKIASGELDPARLARARKLWAEERAATESIHERRQRGRQFGKMVRNVMAESRARKGMD